jgi:hypothetical protein
MNARLIIGVGLFFVAITAACASNALVFKMTRAINRVSGRDRFSSYYGFRRPPLRNILDEYRREYPGGKFHIYLFIAILIGVLALAGVAICAGILPGAFAPKDAR